MVRLSVHASVAYKRTRSAHAEPVEKYDECRAAWMQGQVCCAVDEPPDGSGSPEKGRSSTVSGPGTGMGQGADNTTRGIAHRPKGAQSAKHTKGAQGAKHTKDAQGAKQKNAKEHTSMQAIFNNGVPKHGGSPLTSGFKACFGPRGHILNCVVLEPFWKGAFLL